jgi:hypothetical protein
MLSLCKIVTFGAGWQIAGGDADDVRVCDAHPWQSAYLVFANGEVYGTAMLNPPHRGACARRAAAATAKNMNFSPHARQQGENAAAPVLHRMRKGRDQVIVLLKFCCGGAREGT